jgi:hypothetical protein
MKHKGTKARTRYGVWEKPITEPQTLVEWHQAADAAAFSLAIDAARQFGLVSGGFTVNAARAEQLIEQALMVHGIRPGQRYCRVCGCTDDDPCDEGCEWVEDDLCSACAEKTKTRRHG